MSCALSRAVAILAPDEGRYPLRVRLVLRDDRVSDICVYRSDW